MATRGNVPKNPDVFDAGVFGTLRYDFKAFGGVQGIIPDPSDEMIEAFMRGMRDMAKEFGADDLDPDNMTAEELQEVLEDDKNLQIAEAQKKIMELTAELCGGSPSFEELIKLPMRVRTGFSRWLEGKLMNPEADAASGNAARVTRLGG